MVWHFYIELEIIICLLKSKNDVMGARFWMLKESSFLTSREGLIILETKDFYEG